MFEYCLILIDSVPHMAQSQLGMKKVDEITGPLSTIPVLEVEFHCQAETLWAFSVKGPIYALFFSNGSLPT